MLNKSGISFRQASTEIQYHCSSVSLNGGDAGFVKQSNVKKNMSISKLKHQYVSIMQSMIHDVAMKTEAYLRRPSHWADRTSTRLNALSIPH